MAGRYQLPGRWRGVSPGRGTRPGAGDSGAGGPSGDEWRDEATARLEAVLWIGREPINTRRLAQLASLADGTRARTLIRALNRRYDQEGCAFRAEEVAGGFQLMTRPRFAPWLRRVRGMPAEVRLSPPAMETLAVVAYRQPVLRADIEAVRGVQCGEILRQLIERDLVRVVRRSEELGRPLLYGTTRRFLQVFGLRHLDELPQPMSWNVPPSDNTPDPPPEQADNVSPMTTTQQQESPVKCLVQNAVPPQPGDEEPIVHPLADVEMPDSFDEEELDDDDFDEDEDWDDDDYEDDEDDDFDDEDELDDDFDDDEDDEDEFEDEEEEEDEDDGLEDGPWEEVEDDEEDQDEEEDEDLDEDEDWDEEDEEDWDEDDEDDWDDDDDDEWDDEEEE